MSTLKLFIRDLFKEIVFEIDLDTEKILLELNNQHNVDFKQIEIINQSRDRIINRIIQTKDENMKKIVNENYVTINGDIVNIKDRLQKFCVYLTKSTIVGYLNTKKQNGILLVTDFYISNSDLKHLR